MDLRKYMKLKEEQPDEGLAERDKARYEALYAQVKANEEAKAAAKKRVSLWKIITPITTVTAAAIITLTCIFATRGNKEFLYSEENLKIQVSNYESMKNYLNYFNFDYIISNINRIEMTYDSKSNDKLYYTFNADIDFDTVSFVVVINEKYNYNFEIIDEREITLSDYALNYNNTEYSSSFGIKGYHYKGKISVHTETVYFEYTQLPALGDEAFFESIQQIIQVKK